MSKTLSNHGHFQRLTARPHIAALLFLLSACSGSPVSLGSGLDDEQSALTDSRRGDTAEDCATNPLGPGCPTAEDCATNPLGPGCPTAEDCATNPLGPGCPTAEDCATNPLGPGCPTAEDCATNPLGPGCPTAEDCATNPLGPGCPTADPTAIDCGAIFNECLIEAFAAGEEPARCEAIRWACGRSMYASEPGVDD